MNFAASLTRRSVFAAILASALAGTSAFAGDFTISSATGTVATGSVTDNGGTKSFTFTRNAAASYGNVIFTDGTSGLQAANQLLANNTPDSFSFTFTVTPPAGYEAQITIFQAPYAGGGKSEAADRVLT